MQGIVGVKIPVSESGFVSESQNSSIAPYLIEGSILRKANNFTFVYLYLL